MPSTKPLITRPGTNASAAGNTAVLDRYDEIRHSYLQNSQPPRRRGTNFLSSPKGLTREGAFHPAVLTSRYASFDKLFSSLLCDVVDDPDFALSKDPKVYARMQRDPQIFYCLEVRKAATSTSAWNVTPPDGYEHHPQAVQLAAACERRLRAIARQRQLFDNLLDALLPGSAFVELVWELEPTTGQYVVKTHYPIDKSRIKFARDGAMRLLQPRAPSTGLPVPPYKIINHTINQADGTWEDPQAAGYVFYGRGLADTPLYHYFYFKMTALQLFLRSLERNANPTKIYYTGPQNAAIAGKLDSILLALQNDSVVGIPGKEGETKVDFIPPQARPDLYLGLIEYVDRLITRAILGQDLMTEMPVVGSYAAAQVHASVFASISQTDKEELEATLNRTLVDYDVRLNAPGTPVELYPVFRFKPATLVDASTFLTTVQQAQQLGLDVSERQVRDMTGLRAPKPGEALLARQPLAAGMPFGTGHVPENLRPFAPETNTEKGTETAKPSQE